MKINKLIPSLFLALILTSCGIPQGDFWGKKAIITEKYQNTYDKEKNQAKFTIRFQDEGMRQYADLVLIFPENFGEVGDVVTGTNRTLYASPELEKTK